MASLQDNVSKLSLHLSDLEQRRFENDFANDIFEAADYWRDLGKYVLDNDTRVNYPERAREELALLDSFREMLRQRSPEEQRWYGPVFELASEILRFVGTVQPPKDGHLGVLRIIRENFRFLQTDYGFAIADEQPMGIRFTSGAVYVELEYAKQSTMCCVFGQDVKGSELFWPEDLLFMYKDPRYRELQDDRELETASEVESWFASLADIWKQYGHDVLSNQPGVFQRLSQAQAERDQEITQEMDRKYGNGKGRLVDD